VAGVIFSLKKGGDAGQPRTTQQIAPPVTKVNEESIYPRAIAGRLDNFKEAIGLTPVQSWGEKTKYGIALGVSTNQGLNQSSARLVLARPTTSPVVLQVQYAVTEDLVKAISADVATRAKYDGVTILLTTVGVAYNQSTLLTLDPVSIVDQRKWLTCNLALPTGTREIHFSIIGPPPNYNVFEDSCIICLPQLRVIPAQAAPVEAKPSPR
jgi:hypothetical protein